VQSATGFYSIHRAVNSPKIENNMKIEASISLRRRDEEVKVHGEPDCCNLG
jgi:hypothetical protein